MNLVIRDTQRRLVGRVDVDPAERPTRVNVDHADREVFLRWDGAVDDAGRLRRCIVCGCGDLFVQKALPQLTGFVVVLAFAGAAVGLLGFATRPPVLAAMVVVLGLDVAILFMPRRLVCYRCRSSFRGPPIARYHRPWDRPTAERNPADVIGRGSGVAGSRFSVLRRVSTKPKTENREPRTRPPRPRR